MKLNSATKIVGLKTVLVPYRISHVERYHKWMESDDLRKLTASERLTLEEEYDMQQSWLHDEDKCTFIVLDRSLLENTENEVESMIGDANLYLSKEEGGIQVGEIGLMIAEPDYRNQGRGKETALHLLRYGVECIGIKKYIAVISMENVRSIKFFSSLKFSKEGESNIFQEVTFCRAVDVEWYEWLKHETCNYHLHSTEPNK